MSYPNPVAMQRESLSPYYFTERQRFEKEFGNHSCQFELDDLTGMIMNWRGKKVPSGSGIRSDTGEGEIYAILRAALLDSELSICYAGFSAEIEWAMN